MSKLVTLLIASAFAFASASTFAQSDSTDAPAGETKMEEQHDMTEGAEQDCEALSGEAKDDCEQAMEEDRAMSGEMEGEKTEGEKGAY